MDLLQQVLIAVISKSSYAVHADKLATLVNREMLLTLGAISEILSERNLSAEQQLKKIRIALSGIGLAENSEKSPVAPCKSERNGV